MPTHSAIELQFDTASAYRARDLTAFEQRMDHWLQHTIRNGRGRNYGQALHMYHTYRGLFALEADRVEEAKLHLLQSAGIPRSPVVFAFGPNMLLAKQLLERGERLVLYQFFSLCKLCWWFPLRWYRVAQWRGAMLRGELPGFGGNLYYHMGDPPPWVRA